MVYFEIINIVWTLAQATSKQYSPKKMNKNTESKLPLSFQN